MGLTSLRRHREGIKATPPIARPATKPSYVVEQERQRELSVLRTRLAELEEFKTKYEGLQERLENAEMAVSLFKDGADSGARLLGELTATNDKLAADNRELTARNHEFEEQLLDALGKVELLEAKSQEPAPEPPAVGDTQPPSDGPPTDAPAAPAAGEAAKVKPRRSRRRNG